MKTGHEMFPLSGEELSKLAEEGTYSCPLSHHTSSSPSGNNSRHCCHERKPITLSVAIAPAYRIECSSRSSFKFWCSVALTKESPPSRVLGHYTLRRRRDEWIEAGSMETLEELTLESYDRIIGLELFARWPSIAASREGSAWRPQGG